LESILEIAEVRCQCPVEHLGIYCRNFHQETEFAQSCVGSGGRELLAQNVVEICESEGGNATDQLGVLNAQEDLCGLLEEGLSLEQQVKDDVGIEEDLLRLAG
jgi:hypothetical protein